MLTIVLGNKGSGKTLLLTLLASQTKKPIYSNYVLNLPNYHELSLFELVNNKYLNSMILMDEMYTYLEARLSGKALNEVLSYVLFQSRKTGIEIIGSAQLIKTIDVRFRDMSDILVHCDKVGKNTYQYKFLSVYNARTKVVILRPQITKALYQLYDTRQIITPPLQSDFTKKLLTPEDKIRESQRCFELLKSQYKVISIGTLRFWALKQKLDNEILKTLLWQCRDSNFIGRKTVNLFPSQRAKT